MSSGAHPTHPKNLGDNVEHEVIQPEPNLEFVADAVAGWHDARTSGLLTPTQDRPFGGVCVVECDTPVEIKGTVPEHANGRSGTWYIKRNAHEQLLEADGVYWLVVYNPIPSTPILAELVVPAATVDAFLDGFWYDNGRREVAKLAWPKLIDEGRVNGGGALMSVSGPLSDITPLVFKASPQEAHHSQDRTRISSNVGSREGRRRGGRPSVWTAQSSLRPYLAFAPAQSATALCSGPSSRRHSITSSSSPSHMQATQPRQQEVQA